MSHLSIDSIIAANTYNRLMIDHKATERAAFLNLKHNYLPALSKTLTTHGVADFVELHLLHRHFDLDEGEAVVHRTLEIPGSGDITSTCVDVAKAMNCAKPVGSSLVPLLWMASSGDNLIAYEYGLDGSSGSHKRGIESISSEKWTAFAREFSAQVYAAGIADIVSLKDKQCTNGDEYVVPTMRVLFRLPKASIHLQPGSEVIESGWGSAATAGPDAGFPECMDGHVTKTRKTTAGTVAVSHVTEETGSDAFNPEEVPLLYTNVMWAAAKSEDFWAVNGNGDIAV